jgi:hypothetical protein
MKYRYFHHDYSDTQTWQSLHIHVATFNKQYTKKNIKKKRWFTYIYIYINVHTENQPYKNPYLRSIIPCTSLCIGTSR